MEVVDSMEVVDTRADDDEDDEDDDEVDLVGETTNTTATTDRRATIVATIVPVDNVPDRTSRRLSLLDDDLPLTAAVAGRCFDLPSAMTRIDFFRPNYLRGGCITDLPLRSVIRSIDSASVAGAGLRWGMEGGGGGGGNNIPPQNSSVEKHE